MAILTPAGRIQTKSKEARSNHRALRTLDPKIVSTGSFDTRRKFDGLLGFAD
jgi:hypothetical protein